MSETAIQPSSTFAMKYPASPNDSCSKHKTSLTIYYLRTTLRIMYIAPIYIYLSILTHPSTSQLCDKLSPSLLINRKEVNHNNRSRPLPS